jgi:hypothetical protein
LNDTQILTVAIAIVFPCVAAAGSIAALMYSNKRLDDTKAESNKRLDDMKAELIRHMDTGFEHMTLLLKLHEAEHHRK